MRRIALAAAALLLLAPSCTWRPPQSVHFPDRPIFGPRVAPGGKISSQPQAQPTPQIAGCRELARVPCDFASCKGTGYDYVILQCPGAEPAGRCVMNTGRCEGEPAETE